MAQLLKFLIRILNCVALLCEKYLGHINVCSSSKTLRNRRIIARWSAQLYSSKNNWRIRSKDLENFPPVRLFVEKAKRNILPSQLPRRQ